MFLGPEALFTQDLRAAVSHFFGFGFVFVYFEFLTCLRSSVQTEDQYAE